MKARIPRIYPRIPRLSRRHGTLVMPLGLACATLLLACASNLDWRPGVSDQSPGAPRSPQAAASATPDAWPAAQALDKLAVIDERELPSSGHNPPYWSGKVRVNETLAETYRVLGPTSTIAEGSVAIEQHHDASGGGEALYGMQKRAAGFDPQGGDWEYLVLDPSGQIRTRGALPFCARCHAEAPTDHLFGPRVSARRHVAQAAADGAEGPGEADEDGAVAPSEDSGPFGAKLPPGKHRERRKKKK
jgi:hypothetical protein